MAKIKKSDPRAQVVNQISIAESYALFLRSRGSRCSTGSLNFYKDKEKLICEAFVECGSPDQIDAPVIRDVLAEYRQTHSDGGAFKLYSVIRTWLNWYWDEYDIPIRNPIEKVSIHKPAAIPKEGITREEIEALMAAVRRSSRFPERDLALISLLADTGLRKKSVQSLRMKDVDVDRAELIAYEKDQHYHTKTFGMATQKALRKYLACLEDVRPDDPLWLNQDGSEMTENSMRMMLERMADAAGIDRHLFHDFRRFYGLELYKQTSDIYFVSRALDHKDVEVTKRYLAIADREDAERLRSVSPMDNGRMTGIRINRKKT